MRGSSQACVVVDMPYGSYEESAEQAYRCAADYGMKTGTERREAGRWRMAAHVKAIVKAGILLLGMSGFCRKPRRIRRVSDFAGRDEDKRQIIADAQSY